MRAVVYRGSGHIGTEDVPDLSPGPDEVVVAPLAVGVCGTDSHIVHGHFPARPPVILGHEICGTVQQVGEAVRTLAVGDLVTVEPHIYCGVCFNCQTGTQHMCPDRKAPGVHLDGGMAEQVKVPEKLAFKLPSGTDPFHGALTEPIACCIHGIDRAGVRSGLPAIVFGCGPAGAIMVALAKAAGAYPVVAVDGRPHRRDLALRFGADAVLDPAQADFRDAALSYTDGVGYPVAIDAVGSSSVVETAVDLACRGGNILLFGVANPDDVAKIRPNEIYARELSLLGTALNPDTHRRAIGMLNRLPLHELRSAAYSLEQIDEALAAQQAGAVDKVFIVPSPRSPRA